MYLQKVLSRKTWSLEGQLKNIKIRSWIRIRTKISRIRNTGSQAYLKRIPGVDGRHEFSGIHPEGCGGGGGGGGGCCRFLRRRLCFRVLPSSAAGVSVPLLDFEEIFAAARAIIFNKVTNKLFPIVSFVNI
jgi:hypothetical protein